jgi:hypothetical protein
MARIPKKKVPPVAANPATAAAPGTTTPAPDTSIRKWFPLVENRGTVSLPGHLVAEQGPGIAKQDLHPTLPLDWARLSADASRSGHPKAIRNHYARVKFGPLDGHINLRVNANGDGYPLDAFRDLAACNNCLVSCGEADFLDTEEICYSMRRLIARTQTQAGAFLGPIANKKWWIAPAAYVLRLEQQGDDPYSTATNHIGDERLFGVGEIYGARSGDRASFQAAQVTVHLVQSGAEEASHFSLLVHHVPSGDTWYMDSAGTSKDRKTRSDLANAEFQRWLQNSGLPKGSTKIPRAKHQNCVVPLQDSHWTCGLHSMINALVFVRFGVFGWDKVEAWNQLNGKDTKVMRALKTSLHHSLGVKFPPTRKKNKPQSSPPAKTRAQTAPEPAPAPKCPQPTTPTKPTKRPATPAKLSPTGRDHPTLRLATLPGDTSPKAPTPGMARSRPPNRPSTPQAPAPTGPSKRRRPTNPHDSDTPAPGTGYNTHKRPRTEETVTPAAKRKRPKKVVASSGSDDDDTLISTLSTPTSLARQSARASARGQAVAERVINFMDAVISFEAEAAEVAGSAAARVARVIGGLWDGQRREEAVESRYKAAPRGVWKGGKESGLVFGRRCGGDGRGAGGC